MLVGKNLRRRHERSLKARFNGEQNRSDGDDCFSGTDITLQEAIHRLRRCEIATQFFYHPQLRSRQIKRQATQKLLQQFPRTAMRLTRPDRRFEASRRDHHLHGKEFREDEMLAGLRQDFHALRKMNFSQGSSTAPRRSIR